MTIKVVLQKIKESIFNRLFCICYIILFLYNLKLYLPLIIKRIPLRRKCQKINNENKDVIIKLVKSFFKTNKSFEVDFVIFHSRSYWDNTKNRYVIKLAGKKILKLVHEVCHVTYGDLDNHKYILKYVLNLANKYINVYEPRAIRKEMEFAKKFPNFFN